MNDLEEKEVYPILFPLKQVDQVLLLLIMITYMKY